MARAVLRCLALVFCSLASGTRLRPRGPNQAVQQPVARLQKLRAVAFLASAGAWRSTQLRPPRPTLPPLPVPQWYPEPAWFRQEFCIDWELDLAESRPRAILNEALGAPVRFDPVAAGIPARRRIRRPEEAVEIVSSTDAERLTHKIFLDGRRTRLPSPTGGEAMAVARWTGEGHIEVRQCLSSKEECILEDPQEDVFMTWFYLSPHQQTGEIFLIEESAVYRQGQPVPTSCNCGNSQIVWRAARSLDDKMKTAAGDYAGSLSIIDKELAELPHDPKLMFTKFKVMVGRMSDDSDSGYELGWEMLKRFHDPIFINNLAWHVLDSTDVKHRNLEFAMTAAKVANELSGYSNAASLDTLARAYNDAGFHGDAVRYQEQAVKHAPKRTRKGLRMTLLKYLFKRKPKKDVLASHSLWSSLFLSIPTQFYAFWHRPRPVRAQSR